MKKIQHMIVLPRHNHKIQIELEHATENDLINSLTTDWVLVHVTYAYAYVTI